MTDFKAKMHQIRLRLGLRSRPRWGSLQRSPRSPSWIWGALLLRRGEGRGEEETGGEGRRGKGRGKGHEPPPTIWRKFTPMPEVTSVQHILEILPSISLTVSLTIFLYRLQSPWSRLCCIRLSKFVIIITSHNRAPRDCGSASNR